MGDGRFGWQTSLNQPRRSRSLNDTVGTSATRIFGTAGHDDTELRGNYIQSFRHILANPHL